MDENIISILAYVNLQKALLTNLLADILSKESAPDVGLQGFYNGVKRDLEKTNFPNQGADIEEVRQQAITLAGVLFQDTEGILLSRGVVASQKLSL